MPDVAQRDPRSRSEGHAADSDHGSTVLDQDATGPGGPVWYDEARPLASCHSDHSIEFIIECPQGDHDALVWRERPAMRGSGWACPQGHHGRLWGLL